MTDPVEPGLPENLGPLQALRRVAAVFYAPRRTARAIRDNPNWVFPLLLTIVLSFLLAAALFSRPEWKETLQKALAAAPKTLGELEKVQLMHTMQGMAWFGALAAVVIGNLFLALLLWGMALIMEGKVRFVTILSFQLHVQMVTLIPQAVALGILLARNGKDVATDDPLPFSLAYFLPSQGVSPIVKGLAASADLFSFWYWALVLLGLPIIAGLPRKKVLLPVLLLVCIGILVRAATFSLAVAGP